MNKMAHIVMTWLIPVWHHWFCSWASNCQYVCIGSGNGLVVIDKNITDCNAAKTLANSHQISYWDSLIEYESHCIQLYSTGLRMCHYKKGKLYVQRTTPTLVKRKKCSFLEAQKWPSKAFRLSDMHHCTVQYASPHKMPIPETITE